MGLWTWLTGVDLEDEQRRSDAADLRLRELNVEAWQRGKLTDEELGQRDARITAGAIDATGQVSGAFKEGWAEGYANTTGAIRTGLAAPFNFAFKSIPWQVWLALALYLAWKTGWLTKLLKAR